MCRLETGQSCSLRPKVASLLSGGRLCSPETFTWLGETHSTKWGKRLYSKSASYLLTSPEKHLLSNIE